MGDFSVSVVFEDLENHQDCIISAVYGANSSQRRNDFWRELETVTANWSGPWCIGGDFNIIRYPYEKPDGCRLATDMQVFSNWINSQGLMDLQLNGASFTRSDHQTHPVMSQLDRFLISGDWVTFTLILVK